MANKYQTIALELKEQIKSGEYAFGDILPTELALTQQYQVSRQTVRQALSVLASEGLVERRQGSGSRVIASEPAASSHPHRTVAVIATYISDYIFPATLREVEAVLAKHNCTTSLFSTQNEIATERNILTNILNMSFDGILVEGTKAALPNPNLDLYYKLMERGIPLVFFHGNYRDLPEAMFVLDDNFDGGMQLVNYLYNKGHRHIGGIFKSDDIQGHQRYSGYFTAIRDLNLPMDDKNVIWYNTEDKATLFSSHIAPSIVAATNNVTAMVCYNDEVANSLIHSALNRGLRVPEDLAVVSFDNSLHSELCPVRITSLSHNEFNVGRLAAELLMKQMYGEQCNSRKAPWFLVEKESS